MQKLLKLVRGWDAAAAHALRAVPKDTQPRVFSAENGMSLLYPCKYGKVDMSKALGASHLS